MIVAMDLACRLYDAVFAENHSPTLLFLVTAASMALGALGASLLAPLTIARPTGA